MQGEFDKKGFRFSAFFIFCCVLLILLVKIGSAVGFNSYFSRTIGSLFRNPATLSQEQSEGLRQVTAEEYAVMDMQSGAMLADRDPAGMRPIASLTKLMTASVALDSLDLAKKVTISQQAAATYQETDFQPGMIWLTSDLFYPLLMESSNDAASALAEAYPITSAAGGAGSMANQPLIARQAYAENAFVAEMNARAATLGMKSTHFVDPSGLSDSDLSSADDLLKLAGYLLNDQLTIFSLTKVDEKIVTTSDGALEFGNNNIFNDDPSFIGGKVGYTPEAGETMIAVFRLPKGPEAGHTIGIVVLGSQDRMQDVADILAWLEQPQEK